MDLSIRLRWVDPCFRNYEGSNAEVEETCWSESSGSCCSVCMRWSPWDRF